MTSIRSRYPGCALHAATRRIASVTSSLALSGSIVLRNRERQDQFLRFRIVLAKQAEGNYGELINARPAEHPGIFLEDADHLVLAAIHLHDFPDRVRYARRANRPPQLRARRRPRECSSSNREMNRPCATENKRNRIGILRFRAAKDDPLDDVAGIADIVALARRRMRAFRRSSRIRPKDTRRG